MTGTEAGNKKHENVILRTGSSLTPLRIGLKQPVGLIPRIVSAQTLAADKGRS